MVNRTQREMKRGEFDLIEQIKELFAQPLGTEGLGIGDDCAIIPAGDHDLLISTDMVIEGVHFLRAEASAYDVGYKSAAVNISDIAAMGGTPIATFLSIALPQDARGEWVEGFLAGYRAISNLYGVALLGGDTTSSLRNIAINVAIIGRIERGKALLRCGAKVGDTIYVTAPLGDSGAGLKAILEHTERCADVEYLLHRHYRPTPRITEGRAITLSGEGHAMMDISDGIASDLGHIVRASGVGAEVDLNAIPISPQLQRVASQQGWNPQELAASAGEDYELLVVGSQSLPKAINIPLYPIGRITNGKGIEWLQGDKKVIFEKRGFKHF